jgi:hypothetical protein
VAIDFPKANAELVKKNFFEYLDFALQFAPAGLEERVIREKLARIGVGPGKTFDFKDLPLEHKLEIGLGMKDGEDKVEKYLVDGQKDVNGKIGSLFGDRLFFSGDWLKRAAAPKGGIYGNDAVEAVYPMTKTLADGEVLVGSKHNYTITFPAGQLPPVDAFWSVTMYEGKSQLLIENPINRYLINSPMLPAMKTNADGSLTLWHSRSTPSSGNTRAFPHLRFVPNAEVIRYSRVFCGRQPRSATFIGLCGVSTPTSRTFEWSCRRVSYRVIRQLVLGSPTSIWRRRNR